MKDSVSLARFDGPIIMIGFGSIGKGTLPLIERHLAFDRAKFVVIAPDDTDRKLLDERQLRFMHLAITRDNYRDVLTPLLRGGPGRGMIVNLSVETSSVARKERIPPSRVGDPTKRRCRPMAGSMTSAAVLQCICCNQAPAPVCAHGPRRRRRSTAFS